MTMRIALALVMTVSCVKVLISTSQMDGRPKSLDHSLRLTESDNMRNSNIFWELDYNEKKFRIRAGRYYLDMSTKKDLIELDGGEEMEKYSENEKIKEIKDLIGSKDGADKEPIKDISADNIKKDDLGQVVPVTSKAAASKKTPIFNDPIVPKEGSSLIIPADPVSKEYISQFVEGGVSSFKSNLYDAESSFDSKKSQYQSGLRDDEEETTPKDLHTDNKSKIELTETSKRGSALSEATTKSNAVETYHDRSAKGYVFSLIPVFENKLNKKMLIAKEGWCLTHKMDFKICEYSKFWNLDDSFYWDIFKAEDVSYLDKLMKSLMEKAEKSNEIKKASHINPSANPSLCADGEHEMDKKTPHINPSASPSLCADGEHEMDKKTPHINPSASPSLCADGECETDESDDEDSEDRKMSPHNTQYSNRLAIHSSQAQGFNQGPGQVNSQFGYYPATRQMQYDTIQPGRSPATHPTRHSPFSNESVIVDRKLFEKLKETYDKAQVKTK